MVPRSHNIWRSLTWAQVSGSCGDLGTFLPLLVAMVQTVNLDLGTSLIYTGVFNIAVGWLFDVPLPVQPMKMIVTIAVSTAAVGLPECLAAGMFVGACAVLLGVTGLIGIVNKIIPLPVVKGMQLALGLQLAAMGIGMVYFEHGTSGAVRSWLGLDSIATGMAVGFIILATVYAPQLSRGGLRQPTDPLPCNAKTPVMPVAAFLVLAGMCITCWLHPHVITSLRLGPTIPRITTPTWDQWKTGILLAGIPQLPLTTLNSIVAVEYAARDMFPDRPVPASRLATTLGMFNVCGGWIGSLPACNGVGGLAAQSVFGAHNGAATVFLGLAKIALGLLFGSSLLELLHRFPASILGAMLAFAGAELAACHRGVDGGAETVVMLLTAALCAFTKNVGIGVAGGVGCYVVMQAGAWSLAWYNSRWEVTRRDNSYAAVPAVMV